MSTIADIKQKNYTNAYQLPSHWVNDWLLQVIDKPANALITDSDYTLCDDELFAFNEGIKKMQSGMPYAYLVGYADFYGERFLVNDGTLIPRPDTELLVELAINTLQNKQSPAVLELGTGSGCIAISIAKNLPTACVVAVDICPNALTVAQKNAKRLSVSNCSFINSDWYASIKGSSFDLIVSNPPYIAKDDSHLPALTSEPIGALVSKNDGLFDIDVIAKGAVSYLNHQGLLMIEHGHTQKNQVQSIFKKYGLTDIKTYQDYGGNDRVTTGAYK